MNQYTVLVGLIIIYFQVEGQIPEPHVDPQPASQTLWSVDQNQSCFSSLHTMLFASSEQLLTSTTPPSCGQTNNTPLPPSLLLPPSSPAAICELLASRQVPICATCFQ